MLGALLATAWLVGIAPVATAAGSYQVTIQVPSQDPAVNQPFVISGAVSPAADGAQVDLERYYGGRFHNVATGRLDDTSHYVFAQVFSTAGGRTYRVTKKAGHGTDAGVSPQRRIWVTGSTVHSSVIMRAGDSLTSMRASYRLTMESGGDLTITIAKTGRVIWSLGTDGHPGATATLQRDGNFVVHDAKGNTVKSTGSGGHHPAVYTATIREDSNLDIDNPKGKEIWSSETTNDTLAANESLRGGQYLHSRDADYSLVMQRDGDLTIYDRSNGDRLWDTGTDVANSRVVMGPGGALTIYGPLGKELWSTRTSGYPGSEAILQTDGDLVIYHHGVAIWASQGIGGVLGDDYPENLRRAERDSIIDPWRFYNRECTSFVAWRMNSANHVDFNNFMGGGRFGSAYNWDDNARALGYRVDNVPARGAIAESDHYGHVAWVASVGDGVVTIEDYNYTVPGEYDVRTVATSTYQYIHIRDL